MHVTTTDSDGRATLRIDSARFTLDTVVTFHQAWKPLLDPAHIQIIEVDLSCLEMMDSSALGHLALLREQATKKGKQVVLSHCPPAIMKILTLAHFQQLFKIL